MKYYKILIFIPFIFPGFIAPPKLINADLDNPLPDTIVVNMDGLKSHIIPPKTMITLKLKAGKHSFDTKIKGVFYHSGYFESSLDGLINVTRSDYVVWKDLYMKEEREEYYDNIQENVVVIDNQEYIGDIKLYDTTSIFIPKEWDYDIKTSFPEFVDLGKQPFVVKKKIFYKKDFIREYNNI